MIIDTITNKAKQLNWTKTTNDIITHYNTVLSIAENHFLRISVNVVDSKTTLIVDEFFNDSAVNQFVTHGCTKLVNAIESGFNPKKTQDVEDTELHFITLIQEATEG